MRPRRASAASLALGLVLTASLWNTEARAACDDPLLNACINSDTYWPSAGPSRFATVAGTETVASSQMAFSLVGSYQSRPVLLRVAAPGPGGTMQNVVDDQVTGNFLWAYGVTDRLQIDVALPVTFVQSGTGTSPVTGGARLRDTVLRDLRAGFAYTIIGRPRRPPDLAGRHLSWGLAARYTMALPTGDAGELAGDRGVVHAPSIVGDVRYGRVFASLEIGARLRSTTEFAGARVGPQIVTAAGVGVDVLPQYLSFMLEGRAYPNLAEQHDTAQSVFATVSRPNGNYIIPAEWMLAARTAPLLAGDVSFFAGGGGPIPTGDPAITVPRFRFLLGAVYAPSGNDSDGDGVLDRNDLCPNVKGVRDSERPGCPPTPEDGR